MIFQTYWKQNNACMHKISIVSHTSSLYCYLASIQHVQVKVGQRTAAGNKPVRLWSETLIKKHLPRGQTDINIPGMSWKMIISRWFCNHTLGFPDGNSPAMEPIREIRKLSSFVTRSMKQTHGQRDRHTQTRLHTHTMTRETGGTVILRRVIMSMWWYNLVTDCLLKITFLYKLVARKLYNLSCQNCRM